MLSPKQCPFPSQTVAVRDLKPAGTSMLGTSRSTSEHSIVAKPSYTRTRKGIGARACSRRWHSCGNHRRDHRGRSISFVGNWALREQPAKLGRTASAMANEDVAPAGHSIERATVRQRKTGRPVKFELTERPGKRSKATCEHTTRSASFCSQQATQQSLHNHTPPPNSTAMLVR
jgi:hypothetical protein